MFNKLINSIKLYFNNTTSDKKTEKTIYLIIIIVIIIISINYIFIDKPDIAKNKEEIDNKEQSEKQKVKIEYDLENKLKEILSKIDGVSEVDVLLSYNNDIQKVPIYDEKTKETINEESENDKTVKKTTEQEIEKTVAYEETEGIKQPIYEKNILPTVEGVIIVAKGVNNSDIKNKIILAVGAVTNVPMYKVQVLERGA